MNSLYEFAFNSALGTVEKKEQDTPSTDKINALEEELRTDVIESKEQLTNELAGNASVPTKEQEKKLDYLNLQNKTFNSRPNPLGSYDELLSQMTTDIQRASQAMVYSNLTSKKEGARLTSSESQFSLLNSQFGLNSKSDKPFKNAKKYPKLSAQDSFI
jgi:hypothetical protein